MAATLVSLNAILKEAYVEQKIQDQFNENVDSWKDFDSVDLKWTGSQAIFPLRTARNASVNASSTSNTPAAGQQGYLRLVVTAQKVYASAEILGEAIAAASTSAGSFAIEPAEELNGMVKDYNKRLSQLTFFGGVCIGYVWQKHNVVTSGYSGRFFDIAVGAGETVSFFRMDTYAAVGIATQLNAISSTSITLNAAINTAAVPAGVLIAVVVTGAQAALTEPRTIGATSAAGIDPALTAEPVGMIGNMSLQSHFGLNRNTGTAGEVTLRSNFRAVDDTVAAGGALGLDDLQVLDSTIQTQSGMRSDKRWTSWNQLNSYPALLQGTSAGNLRTDVKTGASKADAGYTDFAYANIPFMASDSCPDGLIINIRKDTWNRATLQAGHFIDFGEGTFTRVPNTDKAQASYATYYNLVCKQPNANGVIAALDLV